MKGKINWLFVLFLCVVILVFACINTKIDKKTEGMCSCNKEGLNTDTSGNISGGNGGSRDNTTTAAASNDISGNTTTATASSDISGNTTTTTTAASSDISGNNIDGLLEGLSDDDEDDEFLEGLSDDEEENDEEPFKNMRSEYNMYLHPSNVNETTNLWYLGNTKTSPDCAQQSNGLSKSTGFICLSEEEQKFLNTRGGNASLCS